MLNVSGVWRWHAVITAARIKATARPEVIRLCLRTSQRGIDVTPCLGGWQFSFRSGG
jgi:hypothetical protein